MTNEVDVSSVNRKEHRAREAAERLVEDIEVSEPEEADLAICLCSYSFKVEKLRKHLNTKLDEVPLVGATTAGEITPSGSSTGRATLMVIKSDKMEFRTTAEEGIYEDAFEAGKNAASDVTDQEFMESEDEKLMFVLNTFDTIKNIGPEKEMLDGINEEIGSEAPVVGGCAGDDWTFKGSKVFTENKVLKDGLVVASLETSYGIELDQRSGPDQEVATGMVSKVPPEKEGVAMEINGQPAAEWYSEQIDVPVSELQKPFSLGSFMENAKFMMGVFPKMSKMALHRQKPNLIHDVFRHAKTYPMADNLTPAEIRIRLPVNVVEGNGLRFSRSPIHENLQLKVMESDSETCISCAETLYGDSERETIFGFAANCANRWSILKEKSMLKQEADLLNETFQAPFIGFYSYGELGGRDKYNCNFKNQTLTSFRIVKN